MRAVVKMEPSGTMVRLVPRLPATLIPRLPGYICFPGCPITAPRLQAVTIQCQKNKTISRWPMAKTKQLFVSAALLPAWFPRVAAASPRFPGLYSVLARLAPGQIGRQHVVPRGTVDRSA